MNAAIEIGDPAALRKETTEAEKKTGYTLSPCF
jgi:hypothetical protein